MSIKPFFRIFLFFTATLVSLNGWPMDRGAEEGGQRPHRSVEETTAENRRAAESQESSAEERGNDFAKKEQPPADENELERLKKAERFGLNFLQKPRPLFSAAEGMPTREEMKARLTEVRALAKKIFSTPYSENYKEKRPFPPALSLTEGWGYSTYKRKEEKWFSASLTTGWACYRLHDATKYIKKATKALASGNLERATLLWKAAEQFQVAAAYHRHAVRIMLLGDKETADRLSAAAGKPQMSAWRLNDAASYLAQANEAGRTGKEESAMLLREAVERMKTTAEYEHQDEQTRGSKYFSCLSALELDKASHAAREAESTSDVEQKEMLLKKVAEHQQQSEVYKTQAREASHLEFRQEGGYVNAAGSAQWSADCLGKASKYIMNSMRVAQLKKPEQALLWRQRAEQKKLLSEYTWQQAQARILNNIKEAKRLSDTICLILNEEKFLMICMNQLSRAKNKGAEEDFLYWNNAAAYSGEALYCIEKMTDYAGRAITAQGEVVAFLAKQYESAFVAIKKAAIAPKEKSAEADALYVTARAARQDADKVVDFLLTNFSRR